MNTIKVAAIIIPDKFASPNPEKIEKVKAYVQEHGAFDKPVILDGNVLVDNYIRYLVAVEMGMDTIPFMTTQEYKEKYPKENLSVDCITGVFREGGKHYTWKNPKNIELNVGDRVLVRSNNEKTGKKKGVVIVTRVFKSNQRSMLKHKSVIKKLDR